MKQLLLICACVATLARAEPVLQPYLPPEAAAKEALLASPWMAGARAKKEAHGFRAQGIASGNAEFVVRTTTQRRRDTALGVTQGESIVSLERPIRFWGKYGMDADLSAQTQAFADIEYADAMHEASRELLTFWFQYQRALADQANAQTAYELATQMQRLTQTQFKHGEVSKLDTELVGAELDRVSAALSVARAQLASAAADFSQRYPQVPLPTRWQDGALPGLDESLPDVREAFLAKNHELNMLRVDAQRLSLAAQRAERDRLPDPTLGVFTARERAGAEHVSGVTLSIPFPGATRSHAARAALADANVANEKVQWTAQQLSARFDGMWSQFQHKRQAAQSLQLAAQRQAMAADKARKAYALGEGSMADVLQISRTASDNVYAAQRMAIDVVELLVLIRLDLHQIWDFDE
jgi:outer membrane protein TolC